MNGYKEIKFQDLKENIYTMTAKNWLALTAGNENGFNSMTVSWAQFGSLWSDGKESGFNGIPVATVYVRDSRYTKKFLDENDRFTLSSFGNEKHEELLYSGSHSGRNEDKFAECGFEPLFIDGATAICGARIIFVCRKLYVSRIEENGFCDKNVLEKSYPKRDFHQVYVGEIEKIYVKEN